MPFPAYETLFQLSPNPYMVLDRELRYVTANPAYLEVVHRTLEELVGHPLFEIFPHDPEHPDNENARMLRASFERVLATGKPDTLALIPYRVPVQPGSSHVEEVRYWSATHVPILDASGRVEFILQHTEDVTELNQLRGAPQASGVLQRAARVQQENVSLYAERQWLRSMFEQAPGFVALLRGPTHIFELTNAAYRHLVGDRQLVGLSVNAALPEVAGQGFIALLDEVYRSGVPYVGHDVQVRVQRTRGAPPSLAWVDFVYQPILDGDGTVAGIFVQGNDVTEQHLAREELARYRTHLEELVSVRTAELRDREAELRQSQKMEALGKLTGGVAHDFNNLLQIIGGNLQLLSRELPDDENVRRRLRSSLVAVDRGAKLSSELLAFARRQPLIPTVLQPAALVRELEPLLRRALGEEVVLELDLRAEEARTFVDRNQLENVLLNVAINARDAMERRGHLVITVDTVRLGGEAPDPGPGEFVVVSLRDDGHGMSPEVLERAIEPFFTTKPEGRGTGLGLSMAYGFTRQSGGTLELESTPGQGTTVRLLLPRTAAPLSIAPVSPEAAEHGGAHSGRVLVVEDDASVRATVLELLQTLGYATLAASSAAEALEVLRRERRVDVLFSDVVMPGSLRSTELARRAVELHPEIAVLFTSGYPREEISDGGHLDPDVKLLKKPYRAEELGAKLRELLAERRAPRAGPRPAALLLVEDEADIREGVSAILEELGHQVTTAASAREARERFDPAAHEVLIADLHLPDGSGVELAREFVRQRPELRIVLATGQGPDAVADPALRERAVVLSKPYGPEALEHALETVARNRA